MKIKEFLNRYCSNGYRFHHIFDEIMELFASKDYSSIREEFYDVVMTIQLYLGSKGYFLDWDIVIPISHLMKAERRRSKWVKIFGDSGLKFSPKYLVNGSNWQKAEKVNKAIRLAYKDQIR